MDLESGQMWVYRTQWANDTRGRAAFTVPYAGDLERMIELEFNKRERVKGDSPTEKLISEVGNSNVAS